MDETPPRPRWVEGAAAAESACMETVDDEEGAPKSGDGLSRADEAAAMPA